MYNGQEKKGRKQTRLKTKTRENTNETKKTQFFEKIIKIDKHSSYSNREKKMRE